jgi:hypothetical protein
MEAEMVSETLDFYPQLTWLVAREELNECHLGTPNWLFCSCKYIFAFKNQANKVIIETNKMHSANI